MLDDVVEDRGGREQQPPVERHPRPPTSTTPSACAARGSSGRCSASRRARWRRPAAARSRRAPRAGRSARAPRAGRRCGTSSTSPRRCTRVAPRLRTAARASSPRYGSVPGGPRDLGGRAGERPPPARDPRRELLHRVGGRPLGRPARQRHGHGPVGIDGHPHATRAGGAADAVLGDGHRRRLRLAAPPVDSRVGHHGAPWRSHACGCLRTWCRRSRCFSTACARSRGPTSTSRRTRSCSSASSCRRASSASGAGSGAPGGSAPTSKDDQVDVAWDAGGHPHLAHKLDVLTGD